MKRISVGRKLAVVACVAVVGVGAALVGVAGSATTPSITLKSRTAGSLGKVLAAPNAHTLYRLSPETKTNVLCTSSSCLGIWKPLLVRSKTTTVHLPTGVTGAVGFLKRGTRYQVTLSRHPLYTYVSDSRAGQANGQRIRSFGGTWLVIKIATRQVSPTPAPQPTPTYPPYY
jgi:predicted lipoprotein with Yx(FWY)xxD motif